MKLITLIVGVSAIFLGGCATPPPPVSYSVPNVGMSKSRHDAELRSITVSLANQSEATGKIPVYVVRTPELWKAALEEALNSMVIFKDNGTKKINIAVKILKFSPSGPGFDMTTDVEARYEIVDRATGDIIHSQNISTTGKVELKENFNANARMIEATNQAVRGNISAFLQSLESIDMNKPMFPARR